MHLSSTLPSNNRIEIADVLRGFAVMGITLIHFIERFSLNSFPEERIFWFRRKTGVYTGSGRN